MRRPTGGSPTVVRYVVVTTGVVVLVVLYGIFLYVLARSIVGGAS